MQKITTVPLMTAPHSQKSKVQKLNLYKDLNGS